MINFVPKQNITIKSNYYRFFSSSFSPFFRLTFHITVNHILSFFALFLSKNMNVYLLPLVYNKNIYNDEGSLGDLEVQNILDSHRTSDVFLLSS